MLGSSRRVAKSAATAASTAVARGGAARYMSDAAGIAKMKEEALLHHAIVPTFYYQDSLPRLPIPDLPTTLDKYWYFVEPLLTQAQAAATRKAIDEFGAGAGPALHEHLKAWDAANPRTSYISAMWYDMYLRNRDALPLNLNPQLTWLDETVASKQAQPVRAANLIHNAVRFYLTLGAEALEPDVFHTKTVTKERWFQHLVAKVVPRRVAWYAGFAGGAYALDMSQYPRLFASTRLPKAELDELKSYTGSRHIVVQRGPRFYRLDVLTEQNLPLSADALEAGLRHILADSGAVAASDKGKAYSAEAPVGALSGAPRSDWAAARAAMEKSSVNAASLAAIDSALFVVTLDDAAPETHEDLSRAMLHGDARNRWYDKCFNLIICANGKAGINWEHAWGDGVAVLYFFNELHKATTAMPERDPVPAVNRSQRLAWDLDASAVAAVRKAEAYSDATIAATALRVYQSESMTRKDIQASKLNPDGVMQMIMQLAHWRAHGSVPSTYESASTAGFKHGRTEVVRPVTPLSVAMCKVFSDPASTGVARYEALAKATARHKKTTFDCLMGKGVDRHLFAMHKWAERWIAEGNGKVKAIPSIFTDAGYGVFKDIRLSTSTLASPALAGGGFGPVSRTSYGVGYGNDDRGAHFHVMNYTDSTTNASAFIEGVESSLKDFHAAIQAAKAAGVIKKDGQ